MAEKEKHPVQQRKVSKFYLATAWCHLSWTDKKLKARNVRRSVRCGKLRQLHLDCLCIALTSFQYGILAMVKV